MKSSTSLSRRISDAMWLSTIDQRRPRAGRKPIVPNSLSSMPCSLGSFPPSSARSCTPWVYLCSRSVQPTQPIQPGSPFDPPELLFPKDCAIPRTMFLNSSCIPCHLPSLLAFEGVCTIRNQKKQKEKKRVSV